MRRLLLAFSLLAVTVPVSSGCQPEPQEAPVPGEIDVGDDVKLTVDGHKVTQKMVDIALTPAPPEVKERVEEDPEQMKGLLQNLALTELLYRRALEEKVHEREQVKDSIALAQREIIGNFYMRDLAEAKVTDAAVQERYDAMGAQLNRPNAQIQHILVERQDQANKLVEDIKAGKIDFLDAAKQFSKERGVEKHGGDLGWTGRAPIRELQDAWENAPLNEVVGPVEGRLGFHILKVTGRRPNVPLEEVEPQIRKMLRDEALKTLRSELQAEAEIEWMDEAGETSGSDKAEGGDEAEGAAAGGEGE